MEHLVGFCPAPSAPGIDAWRARFNEVHVDLGTGDATYALRLARGRPSLGVIGVDTCLDHLRSSRRRWPPNLALLRCDAAALPGALDGIASRITVNFPYGSLLGGLLDGDESLIRSIGAALAPGGAVEVRINVSALAGTGHCVATGERALVAVCQRLGCADIDRRRLEAADLRRFPTSWAKRVGFGRDPGAIEVVGARRPGGPLSVAVA